MLLLKPRNAEGAAPPSRGAPVGAGFARERSGEPPVRGRRPLLQVVVRAAVGAGFARERSGAPPVRGQRPLLQVVIHAPV